MRRRPEVAGERRTTTLLKPAGRLSEACSTEFSPACELAGQRPRAPWFYSRAADAFSRRSVAIATTAPAVTSAVDSHSKPINSHSGRGWPGTSFGRAAPGFQAGLGAAQGRAGLLDVGDIAGQLIAHRLRQRAGVVGDVVADAVHRLDGARLGAWSGPDRRTTLRNARVSDAKLLGHDAYLWSPGDP